MNRSTNPDSLCGDASCIAGIHDHAGAVSSRGPAAVDRYRLPNAFHLLPDRPGLPVQCDVGGVGEPAGLALLEGVVEPQVDEVLPLSVPECGHPVVTITDCEIYGTVIFVTQLYDPERKGHTVEDREPVDEIPGDDVG